MVKYKNMGEGKYHVYSESAKCGVKEYSQKVGSQKFLGVEALNI